MKQLELTEVTEQYVKMEEQEKEQEQRIESELIEKMYEHGYDVDQLLKGSATPSPVAGAQLPPTPSLTPAAPASSSTQPVEEGEAEESTFI
jgi:hypothetical protein